MEVHFTAETEEKLKELANQNGRRSADELVQVVVEGYLDEIRKTRQILDRRYEDLKNGRVEGIPDKEVEQHFREKSAKGRSRARE